MVAKRNKRNGFNFLLINRTGIRKALSSGLFFVFFFIAVCLHSRELDLRFKRTATEQGGVASAVACILQDRRGFMWFGTEDGLYRYDGYDFVFYLQDMEDPTSISADGISCLLEDSSGVLWIGTRNGGLNSFNPETLIYTHYRHNRDNLSSLSHNAVSSICQDNEGHLWVGTQGGGLNKLDRKTARFIRYSTVNGNLSHNDVNYIYTDSAGALWVGTGGGGLNRFIPEDNGFIAYRHEPGNPNSLNGDHVNCIYEDKQKTLWIGTNRGLNKFDRDTRSFTHYTMADSRFGNNEITCILEDPEDVLWVGVRGGGLNRLNPEDGRFSTHLHDPANPHSLSDNDVLSLYKDRSGILWIGTASGGIQRYSRNWNSFIRYGHNPADANSLSHSNVTSIYEDDSGSLWLGTAGGGLNRFDRQTGQFSAYNHVPGNPRSLRNNYIYALCEVPAGVLWLGTGGGGLNRFDQTTGQFTAYVHAPADADSLSHNDVRCIFYEERSGGLWVGTAGGGLNRFDQTTGRFTAYRHDPQNSHTLSHNDVRCIYGDSPGFLWVGTYGGGLNKFDKNTLRVKHYSTANSGLSSNYINCFYVDKYGVLWIGTKGGGLDKFSPANENFQIYRERDGLPDDSIYGILEDEAENLWISTGKGLCRFHTRRETFKNFSIDEGLGNDTFNAGAYYKNRSGEMFFGGKKGLDSFSPVQIRDDMNKPEIVITGFFLANKPVSIYRFAPGSPLQKPVYATGTLTLTHRQNMFAFEFAALHYAEPRRNHYKYKLEDYNREWIETGWKNRRAVFTNIPAGEYTFRVIGSNKDGVWNNEGASLKIKILPPPWKTWWAYILYSLVIAGVLYLLWSAWNKRYLKRLVVEQEKELALKRELEQKHEQLKKAQGQLVQSEKMASLGTLVANVAHEINNPAFFTQTSAFNLNEDLEEFKKFLVNLAGDDASKKLLEAFEKKINVLFGYIDSIKEGTLRISKIVKDLRTFYRQDKDVIQDFIPVPGLRSTLNLVKAKYKENVNFVTDFRADSQIAGYPAELNQAFMNIIINACQAILEKKEKEKRDKNWQGKLTIQVQEEDDYVVIRFRDEGIGMPKEVREKIFDPFFTTKVEGQGMGIGLFITYNIVEKHKGRMEVESEAGKGTTITLYLPLKKEERS
jgi:signal transduction histidine kinase/ligand-binding sensor domain-containing protein